MQNVLRKLRNARGFTLVELLAVIVILGIIAAIAVPSIGGIIENTREDAHDANAITMIEAARLAYASGEALNASNLYTLQDLVDMGYMDAIPLHPEDGETYSGGNSFVEVTENGTVFEATLRDGTATLVDDLTINELQGN